MASLLGRWLPGAEALQLLRLVCWLSRVLPLLLARLPALARLAAPGPWLVVVVVVCAEEEVALADTWTWPLACDLGRSQEGGPLQKPPLSPAVAVHAGGSFDGLVAAGASAERPQQQSWHTQGAAAAAALTVARACAGARARARARAGAGPQGPGLRPGLRLWTLVRAQLEGVAKFVWAAAQGKVACLLARGARHRPRPGPAPSGGGRAQPAGCGGFEAAAAGPRGRGSAAAAAAR